MNQNIHLLAAGLLLAAAVSGFGQPTITQQPEDQSVSLGANVTNQVRASGTGPLNYNWEFNAMEITGATNRILILTNVQLPNAGSYTGVASDSVGSVTSRVATLTVDPTFTKIMTGPIVTDGGSSGHGAWADYDGDGYLDLFVSNGTFGGAREKNFLYHNNGNGTFTKVTTGLIVSEAVDCVGGAWGDYDNDGHPDLFVPNKVFRNDLLYRNNGHGSFTKITNRPPVIDGQFASGGACWADYDNDGYLDLYVPVFNASPPVNRLYRNNGDGTFSSVTNNPAVTESGDWSGAAWADYDNDGQIDLFVSGYGRNNALYRNTGQGSFTRISAGRIVNDGGNSVGCSWADYDNDGFFDLFVVNGAGVPNQLNFLYQNNGDGTFTRIISDIVSRDLGNWAICAWGDYDNDGFIDLFVTNEDAKSALYHNSGDGTFTKITTGSPANDSGKSFGCSWADYDNDGFLDLFVANGWAGLGAQNNFLYHNNGNSNAWLKVKLVGTQSNRLGIGAKVRATAKIRGNSVRQLRQISSGGGQSTLLAHFGLGDATNIDTVRIEWPSGTVQELHDVAVKQLLTASEPPRLQAAGQLPDGSFHLLLTGAVGFRYDILTSSDLKLWMSWLTLTNTKRIVSINDASVTKSPQQFYRAVGQ